MSDRSPLALLLGGNRVAEPPPPPPPPVETAEDAHARGRAEGLAMLDHALAGARATAAAELAALQADMAAALAAIEDALATELGTLAHAIAARILTTVPDAVDAALQAQARALVRDATAVTLHAHPDAADRLACLAPELAILPDPALSDGMITARIGATERVTSLPMQLDTIGTGIAAPPA